MLLLYVLLLSQVNISFLVAENWSQFNIQDEAYVHGDDDDEFICPYCETTLRLKLHKPRDDDDDESSKNDDSGSSDEKSDDSSSADELDSWLKCRKCKFSICYANDDDVNYANGNFAGKMGGW